MANANVSRRPAARQQQAAPEQPQTGGFESNALAVQPQEAGALAAITREQSEIQAAVFMARTNPRDELKSFNGIMKSCQRPSFAKTAMYTFPRGGTNVEGPSVDMARELARVWGNIQYEVRIVGETDRDIHIKGVAWDVETNTRTAAEDKFAKLVQRKNKNTGVTEWVKPDERDLRELVNRRGAICVRNAILQLMPPDIVDEAMREVKQTRVAVARNEVGPNREDTARKIVLAFDGIGVTKEMLDAYLGHDVMIFTDEEYDTLQGIYKSISDGNSKREEYFGTKPAQPAQPTQGKTASRTENLADKIGGIMTQAPTASTVDPAQAAGRFVDANPVDKLRAWVLVAKKAQDPFVTKAMQTAGVTSVADDESAYNTAFNLAMLMYENGITPQI